ncbi:ATP-binding protein [Burkholderia anthina]|uniref:ATP-binding protein n=1 Tax=Burkholderia anthina TaxID=179879 RepID=UPI00158D0102|nr:ATP-binding protein [Burkholderia anthina]
MTTSAQLRAIAVQALTGTTIAGANVFSPRDIPSWDQTYPMLIVTAGDEDADGLGRNGAPQFNVTSTLKVVGRVEQEAQNDDVGAALCYAALETIRDQVKVAVINYPALMILLQQFSFFRSRMEVGGKEDSAFHQGQVVIEIGMEFFQGPDDFYQAPTVAFEETDVSLTVADGTPQPGAVITLPQ